MTIANIASKAVRHSNLKFALTALAALTAVGAAAAPQTFTASATVQNAVSLTNTTPLNFGTIFATKTLVGTSGTGIAADSNHIVLTPTGTASVTPGTGTPKTLYMTGALPGVFTVPGLPQGAVIVLNFYAVGGATPITLAASGAGTCGGALVTNASSASAGGKIVLAPALGSSSDPNAGYFCVDSFVTDKTNLTTTGYTVLFADTTLFTFKLGADLITSVPAAASTTAQSFAAGAYSGSFGMDITFN